MTNLKATYNYLLTQFADTYESASRAQVIKLIKGSFKRLTGLSINDRVTDYNLQEVIDLLSNAKIPHCTFAQWLRVNVQ